jgi:hypothetical protein
VKTARGESAFEVIGMIGCAFIVIIFVSIANYMVTTATALADRFDRRDSEESFVLRDTDEANAIWLCADRLNGKGHNCIDAETFRNFARAHAKADVQVMEFHYSGALSPDAAGTWSVSTVQCDAAPVISNNKAKP